MTKFYDEAFKYECVQQVVKEVKELKKENEFLKKAAAFFAKNLP